MCYMDNFEEYIKQGEPHRREKSYAWQTAIGLQAVDGLRPSAYLIETARKNIEGDITIDEARQLIRNYYASKEIRKSNDNDTEEADKVSTNIAKILSGKTFAFTMAGLTAIHRHIFEGVFKFAGKIRDYNITKQEWVLRGDTVLYVSAIDIKRAIEYDLEQEKAFDYTGLNMQQITSHISKFVSGLWQIHPFGEGNTRTTAVFTILYLRSMGFKVENNLFADYSWYFRNALVRANYQNIQKGVMRNMEYLELFFRNLLMGENNELKNRYLLINAPEQFQHIETTDKQTTNKTTDNKIIDNNTIDNGATDNRTSTEQLTEQVRSLLLAIGHEQYTLKQLMERTGLKHRPTFLNNYINPAIKSGILKLQYPEKPNHPRQKYLLTVKGLAILNDLNG